MTVIPTNISDVTAAVVAMFLEHESIGNLNVVVERSAEPPEIPGTEGWVGIYKQSVQYPSRTLGMGDGFRQQKIRIVLHIKMSNYESGEECEISLENLLQNCVSCLLSDTSLRGTVDVLDTDFEIQYPSFDKGENVWVQFANVFFTGLVNVSFLEG